MKINTKIFILISKHDFPYQLKLMQAQHIKSRTQNIHFNVITLSPFPFGSRMSKHKIMLASKKYLLNLTALCVYVCDHNIDIQKLDSGWLCVVYRSQIRSECRLISLKKYFFTSEALKMPEDIRNLTSSLNIINIKRDETKKIIYKHN